MDEGAHYNNAHYRHTNTEAIVGTAQRETVRGDCDTNFLVIPGATLRYRFLVAPIRPAHVRGAHS